MKEYLNRYIPGTDYAKADEKVHEIMDKVVNNKKDDILQRCIKYQMYCFCRMMRCQL